MSADREKLREGLAEPMTAEELAEIQASDPMHPLRPAPPPIPVRGSWYIIECEECYWVGSSEQCGDGGGPDHDDIVCPVCCQSMAGDGPSEADIAEHGEAVYQRIVVAEARADRLSAEVEALRFALAPFAAAADRAEAQHGDQIPDHWSAVLRFSLCREARSALARAAGRSEPARPADAAAQEGQSR